ncbi:acetylornithine transaminase [Shimazuella kribbensis]|uniref:acetylornithine transaminase n=1 Tax=Shimazuella kribbensis TaxID=139808 RepID=UPI000406C6B2|nr:acetylornithine transaminase [Shimazuella kribbensis]
MSLFPNYIRQEVAFQKGEKATLWDTAGKTYLDFSSGIGVTNFGHNHPKITNALTKQAEELWHTSNLFTNPLQQEVADLLCEQSGLEAVFFCNSGAEANEAAIKLARKWAKEVKEVSNPEIICSEGSFHGRTLATLTATGQHKVKIGFDPLPKGFVHVPFQDLHAIKQVTNSQTAAVLLELVQGEGGIYPASKPFVQELAQWCQEKNILLMIDEIQTGIGRTGEKFAHQHYSIQPDVITLAKGLGNGFPVGAIVAKEDLKSILGPGTHGTTFGGNLLSMSVAKAVLYELNNPQLLLDVKAKGNYLMNRLKEELAQCSEVEEIRGIGLMVGIQLSKPVQPHIKQLLDQGLVTLPAGEKVLRLLPPLVITYDEIEEAVLRIKKAISK